MDLSDDELLKLLKTARDDLEEARKTAYALWEKRYYKRLLSACAYLVSDYRLNQAKSLVNEALRKAVYSDTYTSGNKEITNVYGWLCVILRNLDRDMARKDRRIERTERQYAERVSHSTMSPEEKFEAEDLLLKHMRKLPLPYREILFFYAIQEYSYPDIMDMLGLSYAAARRRVSRAYKKLKEVSTEDV